MSEAQKIIKYCAIAFAIFLSVSIVVGIINVLFLFGSIFLSNDKDISTDLRNLNVPYSVNSLNIDVKNIKVTIKEENSFQALTNDEKVEVELKNSDLYIVDKSDNIFDNKEKELIIYIPSYLTLDNTVINTGAGQVDIDNLKTQTIELNLGAGRTEISNLTVYNSAIIKGGVGKTTITKSNINNLNMDMGLGKTTIDAKLSGTSKINSGIGAVELNLNGGESLYTIYLNKGIGSATIGKTNVENESTYGTGSNKISIDGGIGSIKVNFLN